MLYIKKTEKKEYPIGFEPLYLKKEEKKKKKKKKKTCCYLCGVAFRASYWANKPCYVIMEC